jgi:hypothetical protein
MSKQIYAIIAAILLVALLYWAFPPDRYALVSSNKPLYKIDKKTGTVETIVSGPIF